ncbi:MAG: class I adenylate-forming enzyme family protein [Pyrobaculum sp.]
MIEFWAKTQGDKLAVDDGSKKLTYRELAHRASLYRTAARVLFSARSSAEALAAVVGLLTSPSTAALIDPLSVSEDFAFQLADFSPDVVLIDNEVWERNRESLAGRTVNMLGSGLAGPRPGGLGEAVMYYAGVAGRTMQVIHGSEGVWRCAQSLAAAMQLRNDDVVFVTAPLTHVLGLVTSLAALWVGATVILMPRFEASEAVKAARRATVIVGVPTLYAELVKTGIGRLDARYAVSGGAYLPPDVQRMFEEATGVPIVQVYGLTEGLVVSFQPPQLKEVKGTVGLPLPWVELKLAEDGELLVRSPWNMKRYSDEAETQRVFTPDGFLKTGDLFKVDERGLLYFAGVKKRMIKYKGYPVFPRDLELILLRHPAVERAVVKGEPDPEVGEIPVAYVVKRGEVTEDELLSFVNSKVAFYKKLRKVYFVEELP